MTRRTKIRLGLAAVVMIAVALTAKFVITPTVVFGESMEPTLRPWDFCLLKRSRPYEPRRGDIIIFRTADDPPLHFIKRVVGLPGETLAISNGVVLINDAPLPEPYTPANPDWELPATGIPAGKLYFLGDNRDVPLEATVQGLVATRLVQGRLIWYWRWRK